MITKEEQDIIFELEEVSRSSVIEEIDTMIEMCDKNSKMAVTFGERMYFRGGKSYLKDLRDKLLSEDYDFS